MGARPRLSRQSGAEAERRLLALKATTAAALLCGFTLSWRLWTSARFFPTAPVVRWLPAIPHPLDYVLLALVGAMLPAIIVMKWPRRLMAAFLVLAVGLSLWDQTRWQPWFYQYIFILAA